LIDKNIPIGKQLFVGGWATAFMRSKNLHAHAVTEELIGNFFNHFGTPIIS
jgi:hypothetical protein